MMINKRLIGTVSESKKYIVGNVAVQWCSLAANMAMMTSVTGLLASLYTKEAGKDSIIITVAVAAVAVIIRFVCTVVSSHMAYLSSKTVKKTLRDKIYRKLLRLGPSYNEQVKTSEIVNQGYGRSVKIGGVELSDIREEDLMKKITYVSHQSYLFKGTVRENLLMGKPDAPDPDLWAVWKG